MAGKSSKVQIDQTADQKVINRFNSCLTKGEKFKKEYSRNWKNYEKLFMGNQWVGESPQVDYFNAQGERIVHRDLMDGALKDIPLPKRTLNKIMVYIDTMMAQFNQLDPTMWAYSEYEDGQEAARVLNLFNREVFGKKFKQEYINSILSTAKYGFGLFKIHKIPESVLDNKKSRVPFCVKSEDPISIGADKRAKDWSEVPAFTYEFTKYVDELRSIFDCEMFDREKDQLQTFKCYEYWEKDIETGMWTQYYFFDGALLKLKAQEKPKEGEKAKLGIEYPANLFEIIRMNITDNTWVGDSEVRRMEEYQFMVNKRASTQDYKFTEDILPPVNVMFGMDTDQLPLRPGGYYQNKDNSGPGIQPIRWDSYSPEAYTGSIAQYEQEMSDITAIQKGAMGRNEKGVYNAAHFKAIMENIYTRIKLKEFRLTSTFENIVDKVYRLAYYYIESGKEISVYDPEKKEIIKIPKEYFDIDLRKAFVNIETADLSILDPTAKLDKITALKQYTPELDSRELILIADRLVPGMFTKSYIAFIKKTAELDRANLEAKLKVDKLTIELSKLDLESKLESKIEQLKNQKAQALLVKTQAPGAPPAGAPAGPAVVLGQVPENIPPVQAMPAPAHTPPQGDIISADNPLNEQDLAPFVEEMKNAGMSDDVIAETLDNFIANILQMATQNNIPATRDNVLADLKTGVQSVIKDLGG
jgi:hypothetical protein